MKLRKNHEFARVYRFGAYRADRLLTVYALRNGKEKSYFGVSVGKKVGGSVVRSRVARLLREAVRRNAGEVLPGYDIVVLARKGSGGEKLVSFENSYINLMKRNRVYRGAGDNK